MTTGEAASRSRAELAAWALLAMLVVWAGASILRYDYRSERVLGDQASFLLQALSLAEAGNDLAYDQRDIIAWREAGWSRQPHGLFYQRTEDGWAFAKPYGASVVLAPGIAALGPRWGVSFTMVALLLGSVAISVALLRLRLRGAVVPLLTTAYVFGSNLWWHGFVIMTELFLVCLVGGCLYALARGIRDRDVRWTTVGAALAAFAVVEKAPLLLLLAPLGLVALASVPTWRQRLAPAGASILVAAVATLPYLHYSDFEATNPYAGERYYTLTTVHFDDEADVVEARRFRTDETFSLTHVREEALDDIPGKLRAAALYVVGEHTGMIVFMPLAALTLGGAAVALLRRGLEPTAIALLVGAMGYIAFYVWFFPDNFYGGQQAMGNRYWVQASPVVPALLATVRFRTRTMLIFVGISAVLTAVAVGHHHLDPEHAYRDFDDTGAVQELFPEDP